MTRASELGRRAEDHAAAYVASLGWEIIGRNVSGRYGELDIVAMDPAADELVVVEVRCRTIGRVQSPVASVGPRKLRTLTDAGRSFVDDMGWDGPWRIDLIGITAGRSPSEAEWHLEHVHDITSG